MSAPAERTNLEMVFDCIEHNLRQIDNDHDFRTNGLVVDRARDPRIVAENKPELYRQYHGAISVIPGKRVRDPQVTAGRVRWRQEYALMCLVTYTKDHEAAGRTLDEIVFDLQDDIWRCVRGDMTLDKARAELGLTGVEVAIVNHQVNEFHTDEGANFPHAHFIAYCSFVFDERP